MDERSELTGSIPSQPGLGPSPPTYPPPRTPSPSLPEIPTTGLDLTYSFDSIMGTSSPPSAEPHPVERVQKRASNVLKLTEENEKLKEQLKAMSARLEAAERRRQEIATQQLQQTEQQQPNTVVGDMVNQPARSQDSR